METNNVKSAAAKKAVKKPVGKVKTVADYVSWQVDLCGKPQKQIAEEAGFQQPNIVTMFKQGKTKVPLDKVGKLARALEVDPLHLLRMCMREYWPDTYPEIEGIFDQPILTANELKILEVIRKANVVNPKIRTTEDEVRLMVAIESLKPDNAVN